MLYYNKDIIILNSQLGMRVIILNAIVFDLELIKRFKKGQLSQIVEIGACKIDLATYNIIDTFQIYIAPKGGYVAKSTRKFINMKKEDLKQAVSFLEGIDMFIHWIGSDYYLCSWGRDDRVHLLDQCIRSKMDVSWILNYNDIQKPIGKILTNNTKNQLGLKNALELAGIESVGVAHRGIDDAINTAHLFIKYMDQISLQTNTLSNEEINKYVIKYKKSRPPMKE